MKRILVVQPSLDPPGGGNCVAAWFLQACAKRHELVMLAWRPCNLELVNRYYGTSLEPDGFETRLVSPILRRAVELIPTRTAYLRANLLLRDARRLLEREPFDLVIGCENEMDFGRRGIQYVHFPFNYLPQPGYVERWYHRALPLVRGYWRFCTWLSGHTHDGVRRNLSLVNSDWTGEKLRQFYGTGSVTIYPPVPGSFPARPWSQREDGFVTIGRISPEKDLDKVIDVLASLRRRGRAIRWHLVGSPTHPAYARAILERAARERSWIDVHLDLPRTELLELMAKNRYGIHGMVGEHFGIAVAELQRAGCIVFVPDQGGQVEIVGGDERLTYAGPEEAIEKIDRVLTDPALQAKVLAGVAERQDRFSACRFMAEVREIVARF